MNDPAGGPAANRPRGREDKAIERSKADIYFHLVWATKNRLPLLTDYIVRPMYRCIEHEAHRLGCMVLAIGGMPDHVHLVVSAPTTVSPARLMQMVKGVSSHFAKQQLGGGGFDWQDNYAVFSLSRADVSRAVDYVKDQECHHQSSSCWPEWERTSETVQL